MSKNKITSKWFQRKVLDVFLNGCTSIEERQGIAYAWCQGDHESYVVFAKEHKLLPIALIVAALIDTENPLLVRDGKLTTNELAGCAMLVLLIECRQLLKPVDKYPESVDKSVDKVVENWVLPVDKPVDILAVIHRDAPYFGDSMRTVHFDH